MTEYEEQNQRLALLFAERRSELDTAKHAKDHTERVYEQVAEQVRNTETELVKCVGRNINQRLFDVGSGRFVLVRYSENNSGYAELVTPEPRS